MSISDDLLAILVCPESKKPLQIASSDLLKKVNLIIAKKKCKNESDELIDQPIDAALYEPINQILYLVDKSIPVLLVEKAISLKPYSI